MPNNHFSFIFHLHRQQSVDMLLNQPHVLLSIYLIAFEVRLFLGCISQAIRPFFVMCPNSNPNIDPSRKTRQYLDESTKEIFRFRITFRFVFITIFQSLIEIIDWMKDDQ